MGILHEYQAAKEELTTQNMIHSYEIQQALEEFAFSRLSKRDRIALVLYGIIGQGTVEQYFGIADELQFYVSTDFAVPYKKPQKALDITIQDIIS